MDRSKQTLGPMIAHTSPSSIRIWLRAGESILSDERILVARIFKPDSNQFIEEKKFSFNPDFDNIALIEFGTENRLEPNTRYTYQIGFLDQDSIFEKIMNKDEGFSTFSDNKNQEISFITGSCRHLYVGVPYDSNSEDEFMVAEDNIYYGDKVFKSIEENPELNPDFMIMSGDQVYCDHEEGSFTPTDPAKSLDEYLDNYHRAYSQPYFSSLASKLPIYMAMDDHEIKNDWHMDMIDQRHNKDFKDNLEHYENGLKAYGIYQSALSSSIKNVNAWPQELSNICDITYEKQSPNTPYRTKSKNLNYEFSHGPARFFSMDVRLERYMKTEDPQMFGDYQEEALKAWLLKYKSDEYVKFIVSAVPLFPDTKNVFLYPVGAPEDKWGGYSEQRLRLLDYIRDNSIRKIVFLSGDVHVSLAAKLQYKNEDMGVYSVICSAFTWPVPGLQRFNFDWSALPEKSKLVKSLFGKKEKRMPDTSTRGDYKPVPLTKWKFFKTQYREHNFCSIKTNGSTLSISYYNARNGKLFDTIPLNL